MTKFDMGRAWNEAVAMLMTNRDVVTIVAGVFFFLPYLAFALLAGKSLETLATQQAANPEAAAQVMMAYYGEIWWAIAIISIMQYVGILGILALLTDRQRPTVGQALRFGLMCMVPFLIAQLVQAFALVLIVAVPVGIAVGAGSVPLGVVIGMAAGAAAILLWVRLSLVAPVMAIEKTLNPFTALARSWRLTGGNTLLLLAFYALLLIAFLVVALVVSTIVGLILSLFGGEIALIGNGVIGALLNASIVVLMIAVWASIHRQLAGTSPDRTASLFE